MSINLFEHGIHRINIFLQTEVGGIDHVQQQRGLARLLQCRLKGSNQIVRQVANKPYRIGQHGLTNVSNVNTAQGRIQRGKQLVRSVDLRFGDLIKQRRFTGVGIAYQ